MKRHLASSLKYRALLVGAACLTCVTSAFAVLPCNQGLSNDYKVYVDDIKLKTQPTASTSEDNVLLRQLRSAVEVNLAALQNDMEGTRLSMGGTVPTLVIVPCNGRMPGGSFAFDDTEFRILDQNRVLLEVWGVVLDPATGEASLGYVVVPVRSHKPPGVYERQLLHVSRSSLVQLFKQNQQLSAYAEIGLGLRFFDNRDYPNAAHYLCNAIPALERVLRETSAAGQSRFVKEQQELLSEVQKTAKDAISKQRQKSGSRVEAVLPPNTPADCRIGGN